MKIICIGRNYREHALELNNPVPSDLVFFMKPETALLPKNHPFIYPDFTTDLHYEVELVLRICKLGKHIDERFASNYYDSIAIGIDFTARDLQQECKKAGLPWEKAKAFDHSAPVSTFLPKSAFPDTNNIIFSLFKNKSPVQLGNSANVIFTFEKIIAIVSRYITLKEGDYIFTGTPAGVGPVVVGDLLEAYLGEQLLLSLKIK